jgi:hypothetical protein
MWAGLIVPTANLIWLKFAVVKMSVPKPAFFNAHLKVVAFEE